MRLLRCLLLGWSVLLSGCGESQEDAVGNAEAAIKKLGGKVTYDEKNPDKPLVGVDFRDTKVTDAGLGHLT
jgi:hypothetical protein